MARKKHQIAVRIPLHLLDRIDEEIAATSERQTEIVVQALENYFQTQDAGLFRLTNSEKSLTDSIHNLRIAIVYTRDKSAKQQLQNALHALCMAQTKMVLARFILGV